MNLRKLKQALIAYVTNTAEAVWSALSYPLTIQGGKNGKVKAYRMHGNTTQNGTPTYNSPSEIQSVGDYNEATGKYDIPVKANNSVTIISLDEPLRKIGDYEDVIDYEKGTVVRYIASEYITEATTKSSISGTNSLFLSVINNTPLLNANRVGSCISNKFANDEGVTGQAQMTFRKNIIRTYATTGGANRVMYTFDGQYTLAEAQALIGDGFEVCYVLAEPIEEQISLPHLPQYNGTTIYETNTQVKPSGIEVQYYQ